MKIGRRVRSLIALLSLAQPAICLADSPIGIYLGVDGGLSHAPDACNGAFSGFTCKDTDRAVRATVGYQFIPWIGVEANYTDFGRFDMSANSGATFSITGFQLAAGGTAPLTKTLAIVGLVGVARTEVKQSFNTIGPTITVTTYTGSTGVSLKYSLTQAFALRVSVDYYGNVGETNRGFKTNLLAYTGGLTVSF